jgi:hypothetical protein
MPVILHMELGSDTVIYPFKFNAVWLEDPNFVSLVRTNWAVNFGSKVLNPMDSMVKKLKRLKILVVVWERKKKVKGKKELL